MNESASAEALTQLATFAEPRYLHQTCVQRNGSTDFHEDLLLAIESVEAKKPVGRWRVHFHVPIHERSFGHIGSTQTQIEECVDWFEKAQQTGIHFEVETYAWNVLPEPLRPDRLAIGIANEMQWFIQRWND